MPVGSGGVVSGRRNTINTVVVETRKLKKLKRWSWGVKAVGGGSVHWAGLSNFGLTGFAKAKDPTPLASDA